MTFSEWYWAAGGLWTAGAILIGALLGGALTYQLRRARP